MSCEIQPARHNHQTTHQQGTKKACMAWPKSTKNANFGPNLVVFGQKILFFPGDSKSFDTHITEKPPRHLVCIVFWSGMAPNGPERPIFGPKWPKCLFWAKFGHFWAYTFVKQKMLTLAFIHLFTVVSPCTENAWSVKVWPLPALPCPEAKNCCAEHFWGKNSESSQLTNGTLVLRRKLLISWYMLED